jgi:hypothetical protein
MFNIPPYYHSYVRKSISKWGIQGFIQERAESGLTRGLLKNIQRSQEAAVAEYLRRAEVRRAFAKYRRL